MNLKQQFINCKQMFPYYQHYPNTYNYYYNYQNIPTLISYPYYSSSLFNIEQNKNTIIQNKNINKNLEQIHNNQQLYMNKIKIQELKDSIEVGHHANIMENIDCLNQKLIFQKNLIYNINKNYIICQKNIKNQKIIHSTQNTIEHLSEQNHQKQSISSHIKSKPIQKQKKKTLLNKGDKKDKAYVAKQYPKKQPSIHCRYIQKNFILNIINQVFSFMWSQQKSTSYVSKFFQSDNIKVNLFYSYMKIIKKFSKRYINKQYLLNLCDYQQHHIAYKMVTKNSQKLQYLSIKQFSRCVKYLIFTYLHQLCPLAILTSKKMRKQIWTQHLIKCRLLRNFMFYGLTSEEYDRLLINNPNNNQNLFQKEESYIDEDQNRENQNQSPITKDGNKSTDSNEESGFEDDE